MTISFNCNQCGSKFKRPDSLSGTLIFCSCGNGVRVPWSSLEINQSEDGLIEPNPVAPTFPTELFDSNSKPMSEPIPTEDRKTDRPSISLPSALPVTFPTRRSRQYRKVDPDYCFNHGDLHSKKNCSVCKIPFCNSCLVDFVALDEGKTGKSQNEVTHLCGPCKNYQIASFRKPSQLSGPAILALILGLISAPVALCLSLFAFVFTLAQESLALFLVLTILGLLLPVGALFLAGFAIKEIEDRPNLSGRGIAITGFTAGLMSCLWVLSLSTILFIKTWQG